MTTDRAAPAAELPIPLGHLLALLMCSDPWPVTDHGEGDGRAEVEAYIDRLSRDAGFDGWVDAYHSVRQGYAAALRRPEGLAWEALQKIAALDPADTSDGFNEWGEAQCFNQAQRIARAALQPEDAK